MSDVYKISVALAMSSNHNAILSALSAQLLGVHTSVNQLTGGFNRLKVAIGGALMAGAGVAILETMGKLVNKTKEYSDELVKLERLGGDMGKAAVSGEISRRAFDISQRVPMKVTDLMKIPGATYSIIGQQESMEHWESLAKLSFVLQSQKGYSGDPGKDLQDLIRAGEISGRITDKVTGAIDPAKLERYLDISAQIIASTHGMVNPQTLLAMSKQGGFSLRGLSDDGYYTEAIMAQALGGHRVGTAQLSLYQQMASGTMRARTAKGLEELGLLSPGEWRSDKGGGVILSDAASKRLTGLMSKDPLEYAAKMVDELKKQGVTDPEEQMRRVARAQGRQTTQRYTAEQVTNFHQMLAERERMKLGYGAGQSFDTVMGKSVGANLEGLKNAWDNLLMAVAGPQSERVIKVLQSLTSVMNSLQGSVTSMNPDTIMMIGKGIAILGASLVGAGTVAILAALGPAGWIAMAAIAVGGLVALNWKAVTDGIEGIKNAIAGFIDTILALLGKLKGIDMGWGPLRDESGHIKNPGLLDKWLWGEPSGGPAKKMNFEPGTGGPKHQQFAFALNVDGDRLAQTIIDKMEGKYRYDTNTPAFNGAGSYGA